MEEKKRERVRILCSEHGDESVLIADSVLGDFTVGEVRALLADSAAQEKCEALPEQIQAMAPLSSSAAGDLMMAGEWNGYMRAAAMVERALGREDG